MAIEQVTEKKFNIEFTDKAGEVPVSDHVISKDTKNPNINMSNLNPRYTFDSFVVGSTNKMAHAVSVAGQSLPEVPLIHCFYMEEPDLAKPT
jgi:chromosomal replication initiator protein